jgi:8-oxo-dGTP pyrophosphatase MutT (NUDIX family)
VSVAAEVAVFVTRRHGQEVLLLLRVPSGGGYWHVVAGAIEAGGETPQEAAKRELWEETGLLAQLEPCAEVVEYVTAEGAPARGPSSTRPSVGVPITCYVTCAPDGWEPRLNEEHASHRWCPSSEAAAALIWPQTARALRRAMGQ